MGGRDGSPRPLACRGRAATLLAVALLIVGAAAGGATADTTYRPPHGATKVSSQRPPGTLPQTQQLPSSHTDAFRNEMKALWRGVQLDRVRPALAAFFPEGAYRQVKAIYDAGADWTSRLVGDYALDIGAAHALLGRDATNTRLLSVEVPPGFAHWVPPGACYNRVGYWETPNSRLVYQAQRQVRSIGIASMISWRGVWYVVHLGAVLRTGPVGVVDDPSVGTGTAVPSSTC